MFPLIDMCVYVAKTKYELILIEQEWNSLLFKKSGLQSWPAVTVQAQTIVCV